MTPILLDTHVFVWALADPGRLSAPAWAHLRDAEQPLLLSMASAWELAIKSAKGKLTVAGGVQRFVSEGCRRARITLLPIELAHVTATARLPHHHRDPFDRMLIAQAKVESVALMSFDSAFDAYDVTRV